MNQFKRYIEKNGIEECAKQFSVSRHTVMAWYYGNRRPSIEAAKVIIRATNGRLSWDRIFGSPFEVGE